MLADQQRELLAPPAEDGLALCIRPGELLLRAELHELDVDGVALALERVLPLP